MEGSSSSQQPAATGDWRSKLYPEARRRVVNKITDTLMRLLPVSLPVSSPECLNEVKKVAARFEEKIYIAATDKSDYLRKISIKMLSVEARTQPTAGNHCPADSADVGIRPSTPPLREYSSHRRFQTAKQDNTV